MNKKLEKLLLSFAHEQDFLHFYGNLPKKARKRITPYHKLQTVAVFKEDYEFLKDRLISAAAEPSEPAVHVEENIEYKLHEALPGSQVIPWGVSAIKAPDVWSVTNGENVNVGIIDTGIDSKHPDLRANVRGGVNTINKSSAFIDPNGHGTHVAGTIAAVNNTFGVVGAAPSVHLYSLKAFAADGTASLTDIAEAIDWALNHNIHILNMSFGSKQLSLVLHRAIQSAFRHGTLMVASSGNSAESLDYPAKYPEVLAVGALNAQKKVAEFSNFGKDLNYVAPGVDILSTWPVTPFYNTLSGTSMAAPHITAICALIRAKAPDLTPAEVKSILDASTVKIPHISALKQGKGAVLATKVLNQLHQHTKSQ